MNKFAKAASALALAFFLCCICVCGQTPAATSSAASTATAPTVTLPTNHLDGGLFYNSLTSPSISGWAAYSHLIASSTYSYSLADVMAGSIKPFNPKVATTSGLAQLLGVYAGVNVFGVATAGVSSSAGASAPAGFTASAGFIAVKPLKNGWSLDIPVRVIAGTGAPQYVFGLGFGWGK